MKAAIAAAMVGMLASSHMAHSQLIDKQLGSPARLADPTLRCRIDRSDKIMETMPDKDVSMILDMFEDTGKPVNIMTCQSYVDNLKVKSLEIDRSHCHYVVLPSLSDRGWVLNFSEKFRLAVMCDPIEYTVTIETNSRTVPLTWN